MEGGFARFKIGNGRIIVVRFGYYAVFVCQIDYILHDFFPLCGIESRFVACNIDNFSAALSHAGNKHSG